MSTTNALVKELKEAGEDFEFYPTSERMIEEIYCDIKNFARHQFNIHHHAGLSILDIGAGSCNVKTYLDKLNKRNDEKYKEDYHGGNRLEFFYYAIEKSQILIQKLDKNIVLLGTDFNQTNLFDKDVDLIFCNPPYSEFENWAMKILQESQARVIYMVIPSRWTESKRIKYAIETLKIEHKILSSDNFSDGERQARAKVDVIRFVKNVRKDEPFEKWFDETFGFTSNEKITEYEINKKNDKQLKDKLELATGKNKVEILVNGYQEKLLEIQNAFTAIGKIKGCYLDLLGISKRNAMEAFKQQYEGLKRVYWRNVFENLTEITERLTKQSREEIQNKFDKLRSVDFTASNIYSVLIWVIKNANDYYNQQIVDMFKDLSDIDNVKKYKSNQKVFAQDTYRYNRRVEATHYCLDYRIICSSRGFFQTRGYYDNEIEKAGHKIDDFIVIARNLGFDVSHKQIPKEYGAKNYVVLKDESLLMEFKVYKNGNAHVKFNIEFMKAFNVEVARILGWIHNKADIAKEFPDELAKGAEKYFATNNCISLDDAKTKLLGS